MENGATLCDRVYVINAENGLGRYILNELLTAAVLRRQNAVVCLCPLYDGEVIEHPILLELRLAFVTSNEYRPLPTSRIKK